jgi:hypothetical protein
LLSPLNMACVPTHIWNDSQPMATTPRDNAAYMAPVYPKLARQYTGNAIPRRAPGVALAQKQGNSTSVPRNKITVISPIDEPSARSDAPAMQLEGVTMAATHIDANE